MTTVIRNGENGFIDTDFDRLLAAMNLLLLDPEEARRLGREAQETARERFNIHRFVRDWNAVFAEATGVRRERSVA
jgi:glycosyltransferase involved in cell wall biosynthesis